MADVELDPIIVQRTQEILGQVIMKPPLTDKLLRKPPFKFLHDIITSVINATGFLGGVFTDDELNSDNIKDRDSKINFLQKAIDHVVAASGEPLKMRPSKTVAGHEAERTNEFLQALANAVLNEKEQKKEKSPSKIVTKKSDKTGKDVVKAKPDTNQSNERRQHKTVEVSQATSSNRTKLFEKTKRDDKKNSDKDKERTIRTKNKDDSKENKEALKKPSRSKSRDRPVAEKTSITSSRSKTETTTNGDRAVRRTSDTNRKGSLTNSDSKKSSKSVDAKRKSESLTKMTKKVHEKKVENGDIVDDAIASPMEEVIIREPKLIEPEVILGVVEGGTSNDGHDEKSMRLSERPPTGRLATATRSISNDDEAKTIIKQDSTNNNNDDDNNNNKNNNNHNAQSKNTIDDEPVKRPSTSTIRRSSARPPSARPAAPRVRVVEMAPEDITVAQPPNTMSNIIMDNDTNKDDDENDIFVVEEQPALMDYTQASNSISAEDFAGKPHGSLVTQILETKKDLETGSERSSTGIRKTEIDTHLVMDVTRRKEREAIAREMERLREGVQSLSRSANPLGKLIGYLEEDVESMLRELDRWTIESDQLEAELRRRQNEGDLDLDLLAQQMREVEEGINDQLMKLSNVKANILRNDERIQKMVSANKI